MTFFLKKNNNNNNKIPVLVRQGGSDREDWLRQGRKDLPRVRTAFLVKKNSPNIPHKNILNIVFKVRGRGGDQGGVGTIPGGGREREIGRGLDPLHHGVRRGEGEPAGARLLGGREGDGGHGGAGGGGGEKRAAVDYVRESRYYIWQVSAVNALI